MVQKVLVSGLLEHVIEGATAILAERGLEAVFAGPLSDADIDCGLAHMDNDICIPTVAACGQYIRWFRKHGQPDLGVLAPQICEGCRSSTAPDVIASALARAGLVDITIVPFSSAEVKSSCTGADAPNSHVGANDNAVGGAGGEGKGAIGEDQYAGVEKQQASVKGQGEEPKSGGTNKPVIGFVGNVPMMTCSFFADLVVSQLKRNDFYVAMPPLQSIAGERDFFSPAISWFAENKIRSVICLLPFGCLGGFAFARGQLRCLQKKFPDVEVTALDYDPSASDINLINRTELVIETAKERWEFKTEKGA